MILLILLHPVITLNAELSELFSKLKPGINYIGTKPFSQKTEYLDYMFSNEIIQSIKLGYDTPTFTGKCVVVGRDTPEYYTNLLFPDPKKAEMAKETNNEQPKVKENKIIRTGTVGFNINEPVVQLVKNNAIIMLSSDNTLNKKAIKNKLNNDKIDRVIIVGKDTNDKLKRLIHEEDADKITQIASGNSKIMIVGNANKPQQINYMFGSFDKPGSDKPKNYDY